MKIYIRKTPNESGAFSNPMLQKFDGCIELSSDQAKIFFQYNGFIRIISTDPVEIEPDVKAWESWKAEEAAKPVTPVVPTEEERLAALESAMLAMMGGMPNV